MTPPDPTEPMHFSGLKNISGEFSVTFDPTLDPFGLGEVHPVEVYLYAPAKLPWWKHWFYVAMGRLRDWPYPEEVIAHGPATFDFRSDADGTTMQFTKQGLWNVRDE